MYAVQKKTLNNDKVSSQDDESVKQDPQSHLNSNKINTKDRVEKLQDELGDDIFCTSQVNPSVKIWGDMLLSIKNSGDKLLYAMCDGVVKTDINENNEFCLYACKKANFEELNDSITFNKLKSFLANFSQMPLKVIFQEIVDVRQSDIDYLKSKFGDKLVIL